MRQVVGKATRDLDAAALAALRGPYEHLLLDLGTGDGKHVLRVARQRPDTLVVGIDASRDGMLQSSHPKRAPANAVFLWTAVEQLPGMLRDADEVHVLMPWGSLLRAVVRPDAGVLAGIAAACRPGAVFEIVLNLHAWRPAVPEVGETAEPTPDSVRVALRDLGWTVTAAEYGAPETTSWARRLGREALWVRGRLPDQAGN